MGTSNRKQILEQGALQKKQQKAEQKAAAARKAKTKKTVITALVIAFAVILVGLVVFSILNDNGVLMRNTVVASTEHHRVDQAMFSYFTYNAYQNFYNTYYYYLSYFGLDPNQSLKTQYTDNAKTVTWYSYFQTTALENLKPILVYAEAATASGMSLEAEDVAEIDATMDALKQAADTGGYPLSVYITNMFGSGVKAKDVRRSMELSQLAIKYETQLEATFSFTDEEIDAELLKNGKDYKTVDYVTYSVVADTSKLDNTSETYQADLAALYENTKKQAEVLAATGTEEAFTAWVRNYLTTVVYAGAENAEESIAKAMDSLKVSDAGYKEDDEFLKNSFATDAAVGYSRVDDSTAGTYKVSMLVKLPYADERPSTATVFDLAVPADGDKDAATRAGEFLAKFREGGADEAAYDAIAKELNISVYKYQDLSSTATSLSDQVMEWAYAADRKAGDASVVTVGETSHLVYVSALSDEPTWKATVRSALEAEALEAAYHELEGQYPVKVNSRAIK